MLQPKRVKYRRVQKGRIKGLAHKGSELSFGSFGLKALESGRITDRQIEAARIAVTRFMKREGKVWINIFPDKPITKKPLEVRMGKGKGSLDHWVAVIKPFSTALIMAFSTLSSSGGSPPPGLTLLGILARTRWAKVVSPARSIVCSGVAGCTDGLIS